MYRQGIRYVARDGAAARIRGYGTDTPETGADMRSLLAVLTLAACTDPAGDTRADAPADTHTGTPAADGPTLVDLEVFQAVRIPLLESGIPVDVADRSAPIVADRPGVVRVTVDPRGFTGDLEVKADLSSGTGTTTVENVVSGATAVLELPAGAVDADTTVVFTLTAGGEVVARYPEQGELELAARVTGPLKVHLVPFDVNGFVPDTSAAVVEGYRAALFATYPVTDVRITVGPVETWEGELDLGALNVRVGELQEAEMFATRSGWDVYWYGMATGVASRDQYQGITGTSEDGQGGDNGIHRAYFAAGAAFGDQKSEDTLIHEVGHLHLLEHTACDGEDDTDPNYPYDGGSIGGEGWDNRTGEFVPVDGHFDLMSYCFPRWVADYSYARMADHVVEAQTFDGGQ